MLYFLPFDKNIMKFDFFIFRESLLVECPQLNTSPVLMLSLICFGVRTKVYEHICTSFVMWHATFIFHVVVMRK